MIQLRSLEDEASVDGGFQVSVSKWPGHRCPCPRPLCVHSEFLKGPFKVLASQGSAETSDFHRKTNLDF